MTTGFHLIKRADLKVLRFGYGRAFLAAWLLFAVIPDAVAAPARVGAWTDGMTGLAVGGFDVLSYHIQGRPQRGDAAYEFVWRGVPWRFVHAGNLAVFRRHPQVYAPRFAGFDAYALAKGRAVRGHPSVWLVEDNRLYLFFDAGNKAGWLRGRAALRPRAEANWPRLAQEELAAVE